MILGASRIKRLIEEGVTVETASGKKETKPLLEGLGSEQIDKMEGTTVDLRLGEILRLTGPASLRVNSRITPKVESLLDGAA